MAHTFVRRSALIVTGASIMVGTFFAGVAYGADARLDQAADHVTKAIDLLKAAEGGGPGEFGGHRVKAVKNLKQALEQIGKAKAYADAHPAPSSSAP